MRPVVIIDPDPHPEARWAEPVVRLPDDMAVKAAVERALNPVERRRFRALWREAHNRNHNGIRTSVRLALLTMRREATERIERAAAIARG
jgi:hypothetical protein